MPEYYRSGPPNDPDSISLPDSDHWLSASNRHRQTPSTLAPLKTSFRKHSATGTTNSSSDLRTPPVRFANPLAHFMDYGGRGRHPSVYLREKGKTSGAGSLTASECDSLSLVGRGEGGRMEINGRGQRVYSEFNVGQRNSTKEVDYRVPDRNRQLEVRVDNRSLFIDPKAAKEVSPQISAFLLREYAAGHRSSVEPKLDDLKYNEVLEAVRAVCPTDLGLFSTPVTASTFSSLARMSRSFQVQKLKQACELYVARLPLKLTELNAATAAAMLNDCFKYGLSGRTRVRLLQGVVGLIDAEIKDPNRLPSYSSKHSSILPIIGSLIDGAVEEHKKGRLAHDEMLDEARLKIPCRVCRAEEPTTIAVRPARNFLQVCSRCRQTTCRNCFGRPCASLIEQFMEKFARELTRSGI